jgi:hypothetical protein
MWADLGARATVGSAIRLRPRFLRQKRDASLAFSLPQARVELRL